jgi:hypothetical protein
MKKALNVFILLLVLGMVGVGIWAIVKKDSFKAGDLDLPDVRLPRNVQQVTIKGLVGGEKKGLLRDEEVMRILKSRYGITLDYTVAGSIEMVTEPPGDNDFVWPSNQIALQLYEDRYGAPAGDETIFNSPIVVYSWDKIVTALQQYGYVTTGASGQYILDLEKLVTDIEDGLNWTDIGLDNDRRVAIISTDPTKSNSGNMFSGLVATVLNGGYPPDETQIAALLPGIKDFFRRLGYLEDSSGKLFKLYLERGLWDKALVVGYENQLIEKCMERREYLETIEAKGGKMLYPEPTVWSGHPLIAVTDRGKLLIEALQDEDIQRLAWERHGFRSGLAGVPNDPKVVDVVALSEEVTGVVNMPHYRVMEEIIATLEF